LLVGEVKPEGAAAGLDSVFEGLAMREGLVGGEASKSSRIFAASRTVKVRGSEVSRSGSRKWHCQPRHNMKYM